MVDSFKTARSRSPVIANGGALLVDELASEELLALLGAECAQARDTAREQLQRLDDGGGWRSATPARHLLSAEGGPVQDGFYADRTLHRTLSDWCGVEVRPSSGRGTYSYYEREGHHLALHRDVRRCDVTLITCLFRHDLGARSGALRLFPGHATTSLPTLARRAETGTARSLELHPQPGQSVLLLGGCVPHEVRPAAAGHLRWISVLCFEMVSGEHT